MLTALQLREKAAGIFAEADAILSAVKDGEDPTDEQRAEYDAKMVEHKACSADAKRMEAHEEQKRHLAESSEAPPTRPIVTGGEELERTKPWANLGEQLLAVRDAGTASYRGAIDPRLQVQERVATGLGKDTDADGGFLVGETITPEIVKRTYDSSELASRVKKTTLGQGVGILKTKVIDETSRVDGSRHGGVLAYWEGEGDAVTASQPKFRMMKWEPYKLTALYYATEELLQDSTALTTEAGDAFVEELGFKLQAAIYEGDGTGKPTGMRESGAWIAVDKAQGQTAKTILWENIQQMWMRLWPKGRPNSILVCNNDCSEQLMGMYKTVGTGGVPVYLPPGGASDEPYARLMGRPVIVIEQCETLGTEGDIALIDPTQYKLVDKGAAAMASSAHVKFIEGEMAFRWTQRIDGKSMWDSALTPFKGTVTTSPFVGVAVRA